MKKLLHLSISILVFGIAFAQKKIPSNEQSESQNIDKMIENIDKSDFTSGILIDWSFNYSNLVHFHSKENQILTDFDYFRQALLDLHISSNKEKLMSSSLLKNKLEKIHFTENTVDIGIIDVQFQSLNYKNDDDSAKGLKLVDEKFQQINGKKAFLSHRVLILSPLKDAVKGKSIVYRFDQEYWFKNSKKLITSLQADFGDGQNHEIILNGNIIKSDVSMEYKETGEKTLKFSAVFDDKSQLTTVLNYM